MEFCTLSNEEYYQLQNSELSNVEDNRDLLRKCTCLIHLFNLSFFSKRRGMQSRIELKLQIMKLSEEDPRYQDLIDTFIDYIVNPEFPEKLENYYWGAQQLYYKSVMTAEIAENVNKDINEASSNNKMMKFGHFPLNNTLEAARDDTFPIQMLVFTKPLQIWKSFVYMFPDYPRHVEISIKLVNHLMEIYKGSTALSKEKVIISKLEEIFQYIKDKNPNLLDDLTTSLRKTRSNRSITIDSLIPESILRKLKMNIE